MKKLPLLLFAVLLMMPSAFAVDKEVISLQQNVALLQGMVREMQRSFDEKMAVMQTLLGQSSDKFGQAAQFNTQINAAVADLQKSVQNSMANTGQRVENLNTQIQGVQSSIDELRARLDKVSEQVAKIASNSQMLPSGGAPGGMSPGGPMQNSPGGMSDPGASSVPSPDVLYNTALRDYTGGNYPLALQEFTDYLRYFPNTTLASNAQFYIGDIYYQQGQFDRAVIEYDKTIEQFPNGNKSAAAQLKKGYALLNMDERVQGVRELNNLIKRFPGSPEASLATQKLASLPPDKPAARPRRR